MRIINVIDEDFVNYKKPSMFIAFPTCSFKCNIECGRAVCQNAALANGNFIDIDKEVLCERYINNNITQAVVLGGLEPFDSMLDLLPFIDCLRNKYNCLDDIVIYTGYTEEELERGYRIEATGTKNYAVYQDIWKVIKSYPNIIVKFGRFIPDQEPHFDSELGVNLASINQYAKKIGE